MASGDAYGWANIKAEHLASLEPDDFEQFCADLIECEAYDRHAVTLDFQRPAGAHVPDGGRDALLTITEAPQNSKKDYQKRYKLAPLTEDALTQTAYSFKSGGNWFDLALRDFDPKQRKAPGRVIEVLLAGGYFKLLINVVGMLDKKVTRGGDKKTKVKGSSKTRREHLAEALWKRMRSEDPSAADPSARIEILDASKLVSFLRSRQPESGSIVRWADKFELVLPLHGLEEWCKQHGVDRGEPGFVDDTLRKDFQAELLAFFQSDPAESYERAAWLVGPPGVGKTRLVLQALLQNPTIAQRTRVAWTYEEARRVLDAGRLLIRHPAVVLIVDDCPVIEVDSLAARFSTALSANPSAHLLIMTPASRHVLEQAKLTKRWYLEPLERSAATRLAEEALGDPGSPEKASEIASFSEGYPWFATLLAREAIQEGRAPSNIREAMKWALAARREAETEVELGALRLRRARCMLAASLTRRVDWSKLSPPERDGIACAVGLSRGEDLFELADECAGRGILRRSQGWHFKYVTPLVLEREVIAWLLGPNGHDPGGRTLSLHGQAYLGDFFETLPRLGLSREIVTGIIQVGLEDLTHVQSDWAELRAAGLLGPRLWFMATHAPGATARELRQLIEASSLDELRARVDARRGLIVALEALATRRDAFENAEASLFRLAQAENESYANNATSTWANLFLVERTATYRRIAERLALLERRADDPAPSARILAIKGVCAVLTTQGFYRSFDAVDGEWPRPSPTDAHAARVQAWSLLVQRFTDADAPVAVAAKKAAIDNLRGAVRSGIGTEAMAILAEKIGEFTEAERVRLRNALEEVRTYDEAWLTSGSEYPKHLEALLKPSSFRERLHQRVGAFGPAALRKDDDALDDALAREGLAGDAPILGELDWLVSDAAVRAHVFAYALGRCDTRALLLAGLRKRAKKRRASWMARAVFVRYLGGWVEAERTAEADAVLNDLRRDKADAPILALAVFEIGVTDERLAWVENAAREGRLDAPCVLELARRSRHLTVSDAAFSSFVSVLVEGETIEHAAAALEMMVEHVKDRPERGALMRKPMLRALKRLAPHHLYGLTDHYWQLCARALIELGEAPRVAELAVLALSRAQGGDAHAWEALHAAAKRDPTAAFRAVAVAVDASGDAAKRLLLAFMFHREPFSWDTDEVLAWVGDDERRGQRAVVLVRPRSATFDPVLRSLVQRFGSRSAVAKAIISRMHSTDGLVASLAEHDAGQLERARQWLADPDPEVRAFAARAIESLQPSYEQHAAYEEDRQRRFGT